jgi:hypothetical protein
MASCRHMVRERDTVKQAAVCLACTLCVSTQNIVPRHAHAHHRNTQHTLTKPGATSRNRTTKRTHVHAPTMAHPGTQGSHPQKTTTHPKACCCSALRTPRLMYPQLPPSNDLQRCCSLLNISRCFQSRGPKQLLQLAPHMLRSRVLHSNRATGTQSA